LIAELFDGHEGEEQRAKDALPTFGESAKADVAEKSIEGVEKAWL